MKLRFLSRLMLSLTFLFATLCAGEQASAAPEEGGKTLADNGFRPKPGGFGFENWGGNQYPYSDLTADDAVVLFGDAVCARFEGQKCIPTPAAKLWLKEMNQMMKGGHCEGMAALSAAFHVKTEKVEGYGANAPFALQPKDQELMRTISTYFVTQALEPVQSATAKTRGWTLQAIVDFLVRTIAEGKDYPTLGIYGADGGHAITPYRVVERSPGVYRVFVYDNNYPGVENFVDIDAKKNRWVYAGAALNPSEPPTPWEGGAGSMDVTLLSQRYEPLHCPFCGSHKPPKRPSTPPPAPKPTPQAPQKPTPQQPQRTPKPRPVRPPAVSSSDYSVFTPNRCTQLQASRKKDKKTVKMGRAGVESQVEGASMRPLRGARGCYVQLPYGVEYDLVLIDDGRPVYRPLTELVVFAPGNVYSITNISVEITITQSFSFSQSGFSYQAGGRQRPTLRIAGDAAGADGYYEVSGFELEAGAWFEAEETESGGMAFHGDGVESFDIYTEVVGEEETEVFDFDGVEVGDDGQALLDIEDDGDIELDIDSDSDGEADEDDADDDNDGTEDETDLDDDGDGTGDSEEPEDFDEDGIPDEEDQDDDNDGDLDAEDEDDATEDVDEDEEDGDEESDDAEEDEDETGDDDEADEADEAEDDDEGDDSDFEDEDEGDDEAGDDDTEDEESDDVEDGGDDVDEDEGDEDEGDDSADDEEYEDEAEDDGGEEDDAEEESGDDEGDDSDDEGGEDEAEEEEYEEEPEDDGGEEEESDDGGGEEEEEPPAR